MRSQALSMLQTHYRTLLRDVDVCELESLMCHGDVEAVAALKRLKGGFETLLDLVDMEIEMLSEGCEDYMVEGYSQGNAQSPPAW